MNAIEMIRQRLVRTRKIHDNFRSVFDNPTGRVVLLFILKKANVFSPTFVKNDPYQTAFNEGQRHLALSIAKYVHRDQEELMKQLEQGLQDNDNET